MAHALLAGLALVSPAAGHRTPALALAAAPQRLLIAAGSRAQVTVLNPSGAPVVVDVARAALRLDLRGRPRIGGAAAPWFAARPRRLRLAAGGSARVAVAALRPVGAAPGDHTSVLLLAAGVVGRAAVRVRMRIGVVVVVRVPGLVRRRLVLGPLLAVRRGRLRLLRIVVANRGGQDEWVGRGKLVVRLMQSGRIVRVLRAPARRLLAHSSGIVELPLPTRLRGRVRATAVIAPASRGAPGALRTTNFRI